MLRRCAVGVLLVLGGLTGPVQAQVQLEWKLQENEPIYLETTSNFKRTIKAFNKETKDDIDQTIVLSYTLKEKKDKELVLEQKLVSLKVKGAADKETAKAIELVQGAVFTLTVKPNMEIVKLEGYDKLVEKIANNDAELAKVVKAILTEETMKKSAHEALAFLPAEAVKPGDRWDRQIKESLGLLGNLVRNSSYTYDSSAKVEDRAVEKILVTATATYTLPAGNEDAPFRVTQGKIDVPSIKGTLYFDAAAGRLVMSEMKMSLKGALTVTVGGNAIPHEVQQDVTTRTTLLKEAPK